MPHIDANGISIYYEEKGEGQPVLFISGTGADLRVKPNVLDGPLVHQNRVIAYDQRGLGQTEKPEKTYEMADYANDAAALLEALDVDRVHVIGVSFGGMVALHLALKHPGKVDKLVLCCTSPGGGYSSFPFHELPDDLSPEDRLLKLMSVNDTRRTADWQKDNPDLVNRMLTYARENAVEEHQTPAFRQGAHRQLDARSRHDVSNRLNEIASQTLICAGKFDGIAPAENQQALVEGIPDAELKWYEGGHLFLIQDKRAWQEVCAFLA